MAKSRAKLDSFEHFEFREKHFPSISAVNESVKKFYTINIPSLATKITPGNPTVPVVEILSCDNKAMSWNLTAGGHVILPPRLRGRPPILGSDEFKEQKIKWVTFYEKAHPSNIVPAAANVLAASSGSVSSLLNHWFFKTSECATYSLDICATPGCHKNIPMAEQSDHLNLCAKHRTELDTLLKNYQKSYGIVISEDASADDVHNMVYYFVLPSIDQLTEQLLASTDRHKKYVAQVLLALKACIYLYRMHLNSMPDCIQTIVRLFLNALNHSETTMRQLVSAILKLIIVPFAICGIFIVWSADLILSDDRHLSIILMAAGAGMGFWGWTAYAAATAAGAVLVGPVVASAVLGGPIAAGMVLLGPIAVRAVIVGSIAAVAGGVALFGIGVSMMIQRLQRRAPHEYVVRAHIGLNNVDGYLQQWMNNAF